MSVRFRRCSLIVAAVLFAGVAACGGGDDDAENTASDRPASGSASQADADDDVADADDSPSASPSPTAPPKPPPQLPGNRGRFIFPKHRVIAFYGTASTAALGVLGEGSPDQAAARIVQRAKEYEVAGGKPVIPAMELIITIASKSAGDDGNYSSEGPPEEIDRYLAAARKRGMIVLLDLQPGYSTFLEQAKLYEKYLEQPDVGLALDPEWRLKPGQKHLKQIGTVTAEEVNEVSAWLAEIRARKNLPEKIFMIHQFRTYMVENKERVARRPGLATVFHIDGFGPRSSKTETYNILSSKNGEFINGYKLFIDEDTNMYSPKEAMTLISPVPDLITYQ